MNAVERVRALRRRRREAGLCIFCGSPSDRPDRTACRRCAEVANASAAASYRSGGAERSRARNLSERRLAIQRYGGACACCGETTFEFLTFDHANDDGGERRKTEGSAGSRFVTWLKRQEIQPDIHLLCWNCHQARHNYGACPHGPT